MVIDGEKREEETDRERPKEDACGTKECETAEHREEYRERMNLEASPHQSRSEEVINHPDCNNAPHQKPRCRRCRADDKQVDNTRYENQRGADAGDKGREGGDNAPEDAVGDAKECKAERGERALHERNHQTPADD